ncbi:hypothetical protein [Moritella viscosa]|uniref:hypothetical protein n=1 Tax=Moritella viscosa TaxID=80854 RepID=UPI0009158E87|nr:hypothetical protein [Moritella viscosa]SGZ08990.1 Putative uncharacterized protein [Moritella viscosa]SHO14458.1 Putative uncharacterized protein [Moritella viscosa]SHO14654.1 Putative uncharacterized protein [Moritella viscosa]SHO17399.1 Putative uncharacterized protein [Moritella viscosa]SHO18827.1 Putative uncharacterized protein [Moritella viscosa]
MKKSTIDHLKFPSGRTVSRCKDDAKKLRKVSKNSDNYLSYNKALDVIAKNNGIELPWDKALSQLIKMQGSAKDEPSLFNWLKGQVKNQQSHNKKLVHQNFEHNNELYIPDGEGGYSKAYQHKKHPNGLLITKEVAKIVEADLVKLGGLEKLSVMHEGSIQIIYEKPGSNNHLAHEFHITKDGVIVYYCRSRPWQGYEAEFHARSYDITRVGIGEGHVDSFLHWTGFCFWHDILTPKVA